MINSAIYNGQVIHKRFKPKVHYFKYKVFSLLLDLSELEILDKKVNFFSFNKFNLISFHEKDHGERDGSSLKLWVQKNLEKNNIQEKRRRKKHTDNEGTKDRTTKRHNGRHRGQTGTPTSASEQIHPQSIKRKPSH